MRPYSKTKFVRKNFSIQNVEERYIDLNLHQNLPLMFLRR